MHPLVHAMGREVRRVPANWEHPKEWRNGNHNFIPLHGRDILEYYEPDDEDEPPAEAELMPEWSEAEKTHLQMYEDFTEGTPISPVMETAEELARWLADNNASAFGLQTATYEQWLGMIGVGSAVSGVMQGGVMQSGVAAVSSMNTQDQ